MDVQYEKTGPCKCKLSITVPAADVDAAFKSAYRTVQRSVRVPGFRPGKAPRHVLEANYGAQVKSDVEEDLIRTSLPQAITEHSVALVASPRVESGKLERGVDFRYVAELETQPEIELRDYENLEIPELEAVIDDEAVDAEIERTRERAVQLVPVLDRDVVREGDLVVVDFEGTQGGVPLQGAQAKGTILDIGKDDFLPGVSAALIGASVPGHRAVPIDFPDDHAIEAWRGKGATFTIDLKELKRRELPELDDDFAQDVGAESLAALRTQIRERLQATREEEITAARRQAMLQDLVAKNPFAVPEAMIREEVDRMIVQASRAVQRMMGPSFDFKDLDVAGLRERSRARAELSVRSGLLLLEVAKAEKIEVSEAEIDAEIDRLAEEAGDQGARLRVALAGAEERTRLRYKLLEDKTTAALMERAKTVPEAEWKARHPDADHDDAGAGNQGEDSDGEAAAGDRA